MREIKFRAWNPNPWFMTAGVTLADIYNWFEWLNWKEVMQYTWLKDKNWKEIYEGDIVRQLLEPEKTFRRDEFEVKWNWLRCMPFEIFEGYKDFWWDKFEVIWNIHENPELLNNK